jgi:hypothetical protein
MKPAALLITMKRYRGVKSRLSEIEACAPPGIDVHVELARSFEDIPPLLSSTVDLVALDGHGWIDRYAAYFGTGKVFTRFCPGYLRGHHGRRITAPVIVLAFCHGGEQAFQDVIARSTGRSQTAFLGSTSTVNYDDARLIYPPLLDALACLGSKPDPAAVYARLKSTAPLIGRSWRTGLVHRADTT